MRPSAPSNQAGLHQTLLNTRVNPANYLLAGGLKRQINVFVEYYNRRRYNEIAKSRWLSEREGVGIRYEEGLGQWVRLALK